MKGMMAAVCVMSAALFVLGQYASADEAVAMQKLSTAQAALTSGKSADATAALNQLADLLTADTAGAGEAGAAMGAWQAGNAKQAATDLAQGKRPAEPTMEALTIGVQAIYGAIIPFGKGDLAAAAAYMNKLAAGSAGAVKEKLTASAKELTDAAAGKADKAAANARMRVTIWSTVPLSKVAEIVAKKKTLVSLGWSKLVVSYFMQEQKMAPAQSADVMRDIISELRNQGADLDMASSAEVLPQDITDLADQAEEDLVNAYTPETPAKEAKPVLAPAAPGGKTEAPK